MGLGLGSWGERWKVFFFFFWRQKEGREEWRGMVSCGVSYSISRRHVALSLERVCLVRNDESRVPMTGSLAAKNADASIA